METRLTKSLFVCFALFLLVGCATGLPKGRTTDLREKGHEKLEEWFNSLIPDSLDSFHEVIELKKVKVHIVNRREFFEWGKGQAYSSLIGGYATKKNEIFILGKVVKGKFIVVDWLLGHELNHLLNNKNPKIVNPDKLGKMGL